MRISLITLLLLFLASSAPATDSLGISRKAFVHYWDNAYSVELYGNYAYVATQYSGVGIDDINDPENPHELGFILDHIHSTDLEIINDYLHTLWIY